MAEQVDWDEIRRNHATDVKVPDHWPTGVRPISVSGLSLLGIDENNFLHWDGKRLKKELHLGWAAKALGWLVAISTISLAVVDLLRFMAGK